MLNILLVGRVTDVKFGKIISALTEKVKERNMLADIKHVNLYEHPDITEFIEGRNVIINLAPGGFDAPLPVVEGLGLVYPQMGTDKMMDELERIDKA